MKTSHYLINPDQEQMIKFRPEGDTTTVKWYALNDYFLTVVHSETMPTTKARTIYRNRLAKGFEPEDALKPATYRHPSEELASILEQNQDDPSPQTEDPTSDDY